MAVLSEKMLAALETPKERIELTDDACPGLRLRIGPAGKSWSFMFRPPKAKKIERFALGKHPALSLKEARAKAAEIRGQADDGKNVAQDKREAVAASRITFDTLAADFVATYAKPKLKSWPQVESFLKRPRGKFKDRHPDDIGRGEWIKFFEEIAKDAPVASNRTFAIVSKLYAWANEREAVKSHPLVRVKRPGGKEQSKERVITPAEIAALWNACDGVEVPISRQAGDALKLVLLTAARPGEVVNMHMRELRDLDGDAPEWAIPGEKTKNGRGRIVPLSKAAAKVLTEFMSLQEDGRTGFVFKSRTDREQPSTRWLLSGSLEVVRRELKLEHFTAHDLRRTAATIASDAGTRYEVVQRLLGHVNGGVTSVYVRSEWKAEMRAAVEAIAAAVEKAVASHEPVCL